MAVYPNNLPLQLSHFIGREQAIDDIKRTVWTTRLLTLTGPGGCGKTRLALTVAGAIARRVSRRRVVRRTGGAVGCGADAAHDHVGVGHARANRSHAHRRLDRTAAPARTAAGAGQLRAHHRRLRRPRLSFVAALPRSENTGDQQRSAQHHGRDRVAGATVVDDRSSEDSEYSRAANVGSGSSVSRSSSGGPAGLRRIRSHSARHRADLPAARWAAAGDRVGRRSREGAGRRSDRRAFRRSLQFAERSASARRRIAIKRCAR